jgi:hypothetical protein
MLLWVNVAENRIAQQLSAKSSLCSYKKIPEKV